MQRELFTTTDILNLLRALCLNADPQTEQGRGFLLALLQVALAMGAKPDALAPWVRATVSIPSAAR